VFRADAPGNRELLNVYSTGPDVTLPFGAGYAFAINGRYSDRRWQDSDQLDSTAETANISILRSLSTTRHIGFTLGERRVGFDDPAAADYDVETAYFTYARELSTSSIDLNAGVNRLETLGESDTSPYVLAEWSARIAPRSDLSLSLSQQYEDSGDQLSGRLPVRYVGGDAGDVALTSVPMNRTRLGVLYALDRGRAAYSFGASQSRERFEGQSQLDRDGWGTSAGVTYELAPRTRGIVRVRYGRETFTEEADEATRHGVVLGLSQQLSGTWDLSFRYENDERRGDPSRDYEENRFLISLVWAPIT
jgi:hypothetical protein